jgi:lipooligosaccharide transport system permease protein
VQRNLLVYKHEWMVIFSGFFEPLFYLLSIGVGVGAMVPAIGGVSYLAFVAPALLAASCMNGAIYDGMVNVFDKLNYKKTYEGVLATPLAIGDVAVGEMCWAISRGAMYAGAFLVLAVVLGRVTGSPVILSGWGALAFPAAIFVCAAFSAMAVFMTTVVRTWQDFDIVQGLVVLPMFLFSGTFVPLTQFPGPVRWVVSALPLYHATALLRQLTTGRVDGAIVWHIAYLAMLGGVALIATLRRLERAVVK